MNNKSILSSLGIHESNIMPLIAGVLIWIYIVLPIYGMIDNKINGSQEAIGYVATDMYQKMDALEREMKALKEVDYGITRSITY